MGIPLAEDEDGLYPFSDDDEEEYSGEDDSPPQKKQRRVEDMSETPMGFSLAEEEDLALRLLNKRGEI